MFTFFCFYLPISAFLLFCFLSSYFSLFCLFFCPPVCSRSGRLNFTIPQPKAGKSPARSVYAPQNPQSGWKTIHPTPAKVSKNKRTIVEIVALMALDCCCLYWICSMVLINGRMAKGWRVWSWLLPYHDFKLPVWRALLLRPRDDDLMAYTRCFWSTLDS